MHFGYASIGFSITENFYANHELSLTANVNDIACLNDEWSNIVYLVAVPDIDLTANPFFHGGVQDVSIAPPTYYCNTGDTYEGTEFVFELDF